MLPFTATQIKEQYAHCNIHKTSLIYIIIKWDITETRQTNRRDSVFGLISAISLWNVFSTSLSFLKHSVHMYFCKWLRKGDVFSHVTTKKRCNFASDYEKEMYFRKWLRKGDVFSQVTTKRSCIYIKGTIHPSSST